ncbi:hypothetical protein KOR42_17640 [Thalassoglobus neptunius]|uniref:Uncharacterized protein n=1 Tax=Thalassoglobus neptunius TaxID=1938619 RepID=A0A5C5X627_9PLAN|nr:hypothetical protein [Thalassoglobus neptunius]TWT58390.1 hypothetical protein KOR42_17640 [Thalassoglobus neptunius]
MEAPQQSFKDFLRNELLLLGVMILAGTVCGLITQGLVLLGVHEGSNFSDTIVATLVAMPAGLFALWILFRHGSGAGAILTLTLIRVGMTMTLAGLVAWKIPSLKTLSFFLTVTVVYLAGLFVETWLAWKTLQESVPTESDS